MESYFEGDRAGGVDVEAGGAAEPVPEEVAGGVVEDGGEEEEAALTKVVPFLVEDEMLKLGAVFSKKANWQVHVVSDGLLITGQNPHSSGPAAKALMARLEQMSKSPISSRAS